jgi:S1-C subfamily serine protease
MKSHPKISWLFVVMMVAVSAGAQEKAEPKQQQAANPASQADNTATQAAQADHAVQQGILWLNAHNAAFSDGSLYANCRVNDNELGAELAQADEVLRSQLRLPAKQGLVVTRVVDGGPAAVAGVLVDDILLAAEDKPLEGSPALIELAKKAEGKPLKIMLMRKGQKQTLNLTPKKAQSYVLAVNNLYTAGPTYRIGVDVSEAGATLRSQLKLPKDQGLVINRFEPEKESPAFKAGLELHDLLLTVNGKPLKNFDDLRKAVQSSEGKPLSLGLLRGGQQREISVTPKKEEPTAVHVWNEQALARQFLGVRLADPAIVKGTVRFWDASSGKFDVQPSGDPAAQVQQMLKQIEELRKSVEGLQRSLAASPPQTKQPTEKKPEGSPSKDPK